MHSTDLEGRVVKKYPVTISTGFALFSMFFGSGNLVFPLLVGKESGGHYLLASLGIILTGVLIPFLGVFAMVLYRGDLEKFFSCFGKKGALFFSLLALSLMGPFGVLARCLTVAHGTIALLLPGASLALTNSLLCALIYFITIRKNRILSILGLYLTPLLLLSIVLIIVSACLHEKIASPVEGGKLLAFNYGFFQGYQTMDLLASFFFSGFIISQLCNRLQEAEYVKVFFNSALVGATLLSSVYSALVLLGWIYTPLLEKAPPQEMLGMIAIKSMRAMAIPCVGLTLFACLTTAVVLTSLFSDFFRRRLYSTTQSRSLFLTLSIGFVVSLLDFEGIAGFIAPLLEIVYPALIVLTLCNTVRREAKPSHWPFTLTLLATYLYR